MMLAAFTKAPADVLDYDIDLTLWLPSGDIADTATATATGGNVTIDSVDVSDASIKVWVSGGDAGDDDEVKAVIATQNGRTLTVCFKIRVRAC
jgi:hypothetical protein